MEHQRHDGLVQLGHRLPVGPQQDVFHRHGRRAEKRGRGGTRAGDRAYRPVRRAFLEKPDDGPQVGADDAVAHLRAPGRPAEIQVHGQERGRVSRAEVEMGPDDAAQPVRRRARAAERAGQDLLEPVEGEGAHAREDRLLAVEVVVKRRPGDAGDLGYVAHRGAVEAALREQLSHGHHLHRHVVRNGSHTLESPAPGAAPARPAATMGA